MKEDKKWEEEEAKQWKEKEWTCGEREINYVIKRKEWENVKERNRK